MSKRSGRYDLPVSSKAEVVEQDEGGQLCSSPEQLRSNMLQRITARVGTLAPGNWLSAMKVRATQLGKRTGLLSIALLSVAIIAAGYAFLSYRPITVKVAAVSENVPIRIFGLGTVEARVLSKVGFEVGAAITELNADHGDIVKEGTVLARLHTTQQDAKVARAKAVLLSAEAAIKKAEVNVTKTRAILAQRLTANRRKQQLVESRVTSPQLAEEAQRDEDVAKADVLVAESDIEVARRSYPMRDPSTTTRRPFSISTHWSHRSMPL